MTKTILRLVTICTLLAILIPALSANAQYQPLATELYVTPTPISQAIGTQFNVTIGISNVVDFSAFDVKFSWNSSVLDYVSHTPTPENVLNTTGAELFTLMNKANATAGTYQLAVATLPATSFTGSGTMFTITLEVLAEGFSDLAFLQHDLSDPTATPIPHTALNGTFDNRPVVVQYELTIDITGNGTVTPTRGSYLYNEGTVVTVTATPDSGWTLDHWLLDTVDVGSTNPYNVTMNANHTLTAVFVEIPPPPPTLATTDATGTEKNQFNTTDTVYITGGGFNPNETLTIYVVPNGDPFTVAASIFDTTAQANASGALPPRTLGLFNVGQYDVWIDRNANGVLDTATEPADTFDTETSGFIVIPEFAASITLIFAMGLATASVLCIRKRRKD